MRVLPMDAAAVEQVAALEQANFSLPWDEASIRAELDNPLSLWLTALDGGTVLGYVGTQTCFEDADILNVCTAAEARRRGVALALMRELERLLPLRGAERITLEVRASNLPAIRLYEKLGYAQIGLRKGYYEKPREDAVIMRKDLDG